jgi:CheY-like chemotaxis protein
MDRIRLLLADDHVMVAEGLRSLLGDEFDLLGTVVDGKALVEAAFELNPEVILVDISMPVLNGFDAVREIRKRGKPQDQLLQRCASPRSGRQREAVGLSPATAGYKRFLFRDPGACAPGFMLSSASRTFIKVSRSANAGSVSLRSSPRKR